MRATVAFTLKRGTGAGVLLLLLALPAMGAEQPIPSRIDVSDLTLAPLEAPRLKAGDTLTVAAASAPLMLGGKFLAWVPQGRRIVVAEVGEHWVGTYVAVNGLRLSGWIRLDHFLPAQAPSNSARGFSTPFPRQTSWPRERDAFLVGRYERHEIDPNMHVWEPWRR